MAEVAHYSWLSWVHIASALLSMCTGVLVLFRRKGDRGHVRLGYSYLICMLVMNGSAFGLYRLFGTFGPFHGAAVVSLLTLAAGMRAVLRSPRRKGWLVQHFTFMYWSVIGLYAAFFSEVMVRIPLGAAFAWSVGLATGGVVLFGALAQSRLTARWSRLEEQHMERKDS